MWDNLGNTISGIAELDIGANIAYKLLLTIFIPLLITILQRLISKALGRKIKDANRLYEWRRISFYILGGVAILMILRIWFAGFESLITFLGLVSAGLAIALKDIVANLGGWVFIVTRHPFNVGDRIQVGDSCGDVIDIRVFQFTLLEIGNWVEADQTTGRIIHIPNQEVFRLPQANYTQSFQYIWNEIAIHITFESDHRHASTILGKAIETQSLPFLKDAETQFDEARSRFLILHGALTPKVYTSVTDRGVKLTGRYLIPARRRRDSEHNIWEEILPLYAQAVNINFAYPTTRFYQSQNQPPATPQDI